MGRADKVAKMFYSKPVNFISVVNLVYGEEAASQETGMLLIRFE